MTRPGITSLQADVARLERMLDAQNVAIGALAAKCDAAITACRQTIAELRRFKQQASVPVLLVSPVPQEAR